jgi:hypothetical protein
MQEVDVGFGRTGDSIIAAMKSVKLVLRDQVTPPASTHKTGLFDRDSSPLQSRPLTRPSAASLESGARLAALMQKSQPQEVTEYLKLVQDALDAFAELQKVVTDLAGSSSALKTNRLGVTDLTDIGFGGSRELLSKQASRKAASDA